MSIAREAARQQRVAASAQRRAITAQQRAASAALVAERQSLREAEASKRRVERAERELERKAKRQHLTDMEREATLLNQQAAERISELESILAHTLAVDDTISFDELRIQYHEKPFVIPNNLRGASVQPEPKNYHEAIECPSGLSKWIPGAQRKFATQYDMAKVRYEEDVQAWEKSEHARLSAIEACRAQHVADNDAAKSKADMRNAEVDVFLSDYLSGEPDAIIAYNTMVLERSIYPDDFPRHFSIAYTSASKMWPAP